MRVALYVLGLAPFSLQQFDFQYEFGMNITNDYNHPKMRLKVSDWYLVVVHSYSVFILNSFQGSAVDAEQMTDDEWRISRKISMKGFTKIDARFLLPFFTRRITRQVRFMRVSFAYQEHIEQM